MNKLFYVLVPMFLLLHVHLITAQELPSFQTGTTNLGENYYVRLSKATFNTKIQAYKPLYLKMDPTNPPSHAVVEYEIVGGDFEVPVYGFAMGRRLENGQFLELNVFDTNMINNAAKSFSTNTAPGYALGFYPIDGSSEQFPSYSGGQILYLSASSKVHIFGMDLTTGIDSMEIDVSGLEVSWGVSCLSINQDFHTGLSIVTDGIDLDEKMDSLFLGAVASVDFQTDSERFGADWTLDWYYYLVTSDYGGKQHTDAGGIGIKDFYASDYERYVSPRISFKTDIYAKLGKSWKIGLSAAYDQWLKFPYIWTGRWTENSSGGTSHRKASEIKFSELISWQTGLFAMYEF